MRFIDLLEFFLGFFVANVLVGMILYRQFAVGFLDILRSRFF